MFILLALITFFILLLSFYLIDKDQILDRGHYFFLYRIPAFIFGMVCAFWIHNSISSIYFVVILFAGIPFWMWLFPQHHLFYNYKYFSLLFLLPFFTLVFIMLSKHLKITCTIMKILGSASLEIYLVQSIPFQLIINDKVNITPIWHDAITIFLIIMCSILGIIIHRIINKNVPLKFSRF